MITAGLGHPRLRQTVLLTLALTVALTSVDAHANTMSYSATGEGCTTGVKYRDLGPSLWACSVQQAGTLSVGSCTASSCTIIATGSASGTSAMMSEVAAQFSPTVRSFFGLNSDQPGKLICSATGTHTGGDAFACSGSTTYSVRSEGSTLMCVFSDYALGPHFVRVTQRMWFEGGSISEVFGSGC